MPSQNTKDHILIVLGYGCDLNTPLGWWYLPKVADFIRKHRPGYVIFCGGQTQRRTHPGRSEARAMFSVVDAMLKDTGPHPMWSIEEDSYSTFENLAKAQDYIKRYASIKGLESVNITIFCEATRSLKVIMLARHFLGRYVANQRSLTLKTTYWELRDPLREVKSFLHDYLAIKFPWLGLAKRARQRRLKKAETA